MTIILKPRRCKHCRTKFTPARPFEVWCSPECGAEIAKAKIAKKQAQEATRKRAEHRKAKEQAKTLADWKKDAEKACNAYIRARDGNVCISCGTSNPNIQYAAGHFRSVKAASHLRYNEDNINTQCNYRCNSVLAGNIAAYRPALIAKIGIERVEALENNNETHRYTIPELMEIKAKYKQKLKELLKSQ